MLAQEGLATRAPLPPDITVNPAELGTRDGVVRLAADQTSAHAAFDASELARRLLGEEIHEALSTVRHYEHDTYGGNDLALLTEMFRYTWSA